ncbi:MAG: MSHA biogenesis protein MshP [Rubrivivax sp.]|nr:MAG: MSHA biogenesis protein MshP [Rubrivivax sp.]
MSRERPIPSRRPPSRGLGALAAIVVLVMLSALAAAVVRLGWSSQSGIAQDVTSARALRAANAGIEWGLYQAFKGSWTACAGSSSTLDLRTDTGMWVTVSCNSQTYNEGQTQAGTTATVTVYSIEAVACNGTSSCPDNARATGPYYAERRRLVQATN